MIDIKKLQQDFFSDPNVNTALKQSIHDSIQSGKITKDNFVEIVSKAYQPVAFKQTPEMSTTKGVKDFQSFIDTIGNIGNQSSIGNTKKEATATKVDPLEKEREKLYKSLGINNNNNNNNNNTQKESEKPKSEDKTLLQNIFGENKLTKALDTGATIIDQTIKGNAKSTAGGLKDIKQGLNDVVNTDDTSGGILKIGKGALSTVGGVIGGATPIGLGATLGITALGKTETGEKILSGADAIMQKSGNILSNIPLLSNFKDSLKTEQEKQDFDILLGNIPGVLIGKIGSKTGINQAIINKLDKGMGGKINEFIKSANNGRLIKIEKEQSATAGKILRYGVSDIKKDGKQVYNSDILKGEKAIIDNPIITKDYNDLKTQIDKTKQNVIENRNIIVNNLDNQKLISIKGKNVSDGIFSLYKAFEKIKGKTAEQTITDMKQMGKKILGGEGLNGKETIKLRGYLDDLIYNEKGNIAGDSKYINGLSDIRNGIDANFKNSVPKSLGDIEVKYSELIESSRQIKNLSAELKRMTDSTDQSGAISKAIENVSGKLLGVVDTITGGIGSGLLKGILGRLIKSSADGSRISIGQANDNLYKLTKLLDDLNKEKTFLIQNPGKSTGTTSKVIEKMTKGQVIIPTQEAIKRKAEELKKKMLNK